MNDNITFLHKSKEPDRGAYFLEDINTIEEQKECYSSIESRDDSRRIHVTCDKPNSSEISTRSIVISCANSLQERAEITDCNANTSFTQNNDDNGGIYEVLEEDEDVEANRKKKRQKLTELSEPPTTGPEVTDVGFGSSWPGLTHRIEKSLDQPVGLESVTPSCSPSTSEKRVIPEDRISEEVVKNKLLDEVSDCCLGYQTTFSNNNDEEVLIDCSNGNKNETCSADMPTVTLPECSTENDISFNVISTETVNKEFPVVSSVNGTDTPLYLEEKHMAPDPDLSLKLKQCDYSDGVTSQVAMESINVAMNGAFSGSMGKKLLVLDVNGLLVDISSYVPYDYDPDDIILKKAVFKRPYCGDFLKFCFERFNVGVWTSRTKRNMDPILDFLLGSNKRKLLFSWDQSHCTYTGFCTVEKRHKPLLLKKLKKLWDKGEPDLPWERGEYNETNTLLLDDTPYKSLFNPRYSAIFPYTYRFTHVGDNSLGPGGDLRVYLEGLAAAENVQEYVKQNPFGQRVITEKNLSWRFYRRVIEASTTPPRQTEEDDS